jgi:hypothetical protein
LFANYTNRVRGAVLCLSQDGACTNLFENFSENNLKGDLSNDTTDNPPLFSLVNTKEDIKEQPTSRNLSANGTRVLQCTCPVAASWKYFSAIHTSPHLTSTHLTLAFVNNIILLLLLVSCTAVNVSNQN